MQTNELNLILMDLVNFVENQYARSASWGNENSDFVAQIKANDELYEIGNLILTTSSRNSKMSLRTLT